MDTIKETCKEFEKGKMIYSKLAQLYESLGSTTKRLERTTILSKFLSELSEKDKVTLVKIIRKGVKPFIRKRLDDKF